MARNNRGADLSKELWINPRSNLKGPDGSRGWSNQGNITATNGRRFLELADIALGKKNLAPVRKKPKAVGQ